MRCPSCDHDNRAERRFCAECGAALATICAACGALNEHRVKFCGQCGASLVAAPPPPAAPPCPPATITSAPAAAGERRHLTVLFCDLVGSTPLSQQLDAEDWRDVIAQYQRAAVGAVARWGGHVAKNLGDGLLAYFGWPAAREDDPERAIRAGLEIVDVMASLNAAPAVGERPRLAVRVGLHSGIVVVADDGEIFGDTPNVAARVQAAAEPDTVVISAATQRLVSGMFVVEDRGARALKGVREPTVLYRVVQPSGVRSRLDAAAGRLTPFVGRHLELGTLVDRWERVVEGEGENVLMVAEAGAGKSRLAHQLRAHLAAMPHTWLECRATPYTAGTPFFPVIELVQQGLAFAPEDTDGEKVQKIERALTLARLGDADAVSLLADFLGLPPAGYPPLAMSPELQRRRTMELLAAWSLALAEGQPLVLLIEDLHWCDPSSLELLGGLITQRARARVLLGGTARPEFTAPWPARSNLSTLRLARLTRRQACEMVAALGGTELPAETVETLVARADGVPLYVEELTKGVLEPGVAGRADAIPPTLADSLMARLDRLSTAKGVAQRAAVLGREFSYELLTAVAGLEEAALRHELARLMDAEIVFGRGEPPNATYTFKHALVQEAAYESLLKRARHELHQRTLKVLEESFPERVQGEPEVAARHAEAAGLWDEAIAYFARAGEQAQTRSAHEEAIGHFAKAIAMLARAPAAAAREASLQLGLGASLVAARGFSHSETGAAYERARELCEVAGNPQQLSAALIGLSLFCLTRAEHDRAIELGERVLAMGEGLGDESLIVLGAVHAGAPRLYQGRFAASVELTERTVALYDATRDHRAVFRIGTDAFVGASGLGAWGRWCLGEPDLALGRVVKATALANALAHSHSLASALCFEAIIHWLRGDLAAQRQRAGETIALSAERGFPLWAGVGRALHGHARVMTGAGAAALAEITEGLSVSAGTGNQSGAPFLMLVVAEAQREATRHADALATVEAGLAIAAQTGQPFFDAELHRLKGDLLLASGGASPAEVESLFRRALAIARGQEARSFELRAAMSLARLLRDQDRRAEAHDLLASVYGWFTEGFDTRDLQDAKALLEGLQ